MVVTDLNVVFTDLNVVVTDLNVVIFQLNVVVQYFMSSSPGTAARFPSRPSVPWRPDPAPGTRTDRQEEGTENKWMKMKQSQHGIF